MKHFFPLLAVVLFSCGSVSAQVKKDTVSHAPAITDSTAVIQGRDLQELVNLIQEYPAKYANPITQWIRDRYQLRIGEMLKSKKE